MRVTPAGDTALRRNWTLTDWLDEDELIVSNLDAEIDELADCVELPAELLAHREAADLDPEFDETYEGWYAHLHNSCLMLAVEQSCNDQGLLLEPDMRALRLALMPAKFGYALSVFMQQCPRHVRALVVHAVFWQVRFERIRRTSSAVLAQRRGPG